MCRQCIGAVHNDTEAVLFFLHCHLLTFVCQVRHFTSTLTHPQPTAQIIQVEAEMFQWRRAHCRRLLMQPATPSHLQCPKICQKDTVFTYLSLCLCYVFFIENCVFSIPKQQFKVCLDSLTHPRPIPSCVNSFKKCLEL